MSNKAEKLGSITIDIYPGGVKKATFTGKINHNDIFSCKITIQRDYQMYLNTLHLKHKAEGAEKERVALEVQADVDSKALKIEAEKKKTAKREEARMKILAAKAAELKAKKLEKTVADATKNN